MIVVRIYVQRGGNPQEERLIGNDRIENLEEVSEGVSRYVATFGTPDARDGLPSLFLEHVRSKGFWALLRDALVGATVKKEESRNTRKRT